MKLSFQITLAVASLAMANPVVAQESRWVLTAINDAPLESDGRPFELDFIDKDYGFFSCGWSSGDFAIVGARIVFREALRLTSVEPGSSARRYSLGHTTRRCDHALQLTSVASRADRIVLTGQTLGTEAADTFTFSPVSKSPGGNQ
nr:hypothetical protein [Brevundimonas diminuta]